MPNLLGLAGAQPQKQVRFAPIYNGRWSSGIWTNRSPLRDAATTRIVEKYYGAAGDALIAGLNVEITNKLTLARRPGNSIFDNSGGTALGGFTEVIQYTIPSNPGQEFFQYVYGTPISMLGPAAPGDVYNAFAVSQTLSVVPFTPVASQLRLSFLDSSMQPVGVVTDLGTIGGGSVTAPSGAAHYKVSCDGALHGNTYDSSMRINSTRLSTYSVVTDSINPLLFGNSFQEDVPIFPLGPIVPGQVVSGQAGQTQPADATALIFYDAGMNVISTNDMTGTPSYTAPSNAAFWSVVITDLSTANFYDLNYSISDIVSASWDDVDRFYDFRLFNQTEEEIFVMIDQADVLYSLFNGVKTAVFTKSANAGQSYMQSVGNTLYFGNGVDQKKWLQSLVIWQANFDWAANSYPAFTTFLIDSNGNIQQLTTVGVSGGTIPTWNTAVPDEGNDFQGGLTTDGSAVWTNRGNPLENWGIVGPSTAITPVVGSARAAWASNTFYSLVSVVIDSNGNLQQVTTAGKTGASHPTWQTSVGLTTTDGTAVWTMIQTAASLVWTASTAYSAGQFVVGNASGTNCLFQLSAGQTANLNSNVAAYRYAVGAISGVVELTNPTSLGSATASFTTLSSLNMNGTPTAHGATQIWNNLNGAGTVTGTTQPFGTDDHDYQMVVLGSFEIPVAGQYAFQIVSHDGVLWGIGNGAQLVSGTNINPLTGPGYPQAITPVQGFPVFGGNNNRFEAGGFSTSNFVVNFPNAGTYNYEFDYAYWFHSGQQLNVTCNNNVIPFGSPISGPTEPVWPTFTSSLAPQYATVTESAGQFVWENLGPVVDFTWPTAANVTLPDTTIIDPAGNTEGPFRTGVSGATQPTFSTLLNQLTLDNPNLIWINQGPATAPPPGSVSTFQGGWIYTIALVNTLDQTISNAAPLSLPTGNFIGAAGVTIPAGSGLNPSTIDTQADYVAIYRSTDGQTVPFLIPNPNGLPFNTTISLHDYLTSGFVDNTPDANLNNLIEAPIAGENTPPVAGSINLTYHLSRIFYSKGNIVYWTSGPDAPSGNGINGSSPLNTDSFPSLVKRLIPTTSGLLVFTVSDVYLIQGSGTANSPITSGIPLLEGVGVSSYNAVDINGSIIGFFTTDNQFVIIDPSSGVSYAGFPVGDQFRLDNGGLATSWNPANVYVSWHVEGEDQAWYVADGATGWYRLMPTPAPETGYTWSPFAQIAGGVKAVQGIEVAPGKHQLLLGPTGIGPILFRDLSSFTDNGVQYEANAVLGSMVLAQPGQVAVVSFITTEAVRIGTPIVLGVIFDEALPYYKGAFDILKHSVNDPPTLKPSKSLIAQRFYMSDSNEEAVCRHMQVKVDFGKQSVQNEVLTLTVFGAFMQEA